LVRIALFNAVCSSLTALCVTVEQHDSEAPEPEDEGDSKEAEAGGAEFRAVTHSFDTDLRAERELFPVSASLLQTAFAAGDVASGAGAPALAVEEDQPVPQVGLGCSRLILEAACSQPLSFVLSGCTVFWTDSSGEIC